MPAEIVVSPNEISLNAVRYPLIGSVQRSLSSNYPPKTIIGEYTRDSSPVLSTLALFDHRGGLGKDIMEGQGDTDRSWYSTCLLRSKGRLTLQTAIVVTSNLPAGAANFKALVEFQGAVYCYINATSAGIYKYDDTNTTWGSRLLTVSGVTDGLSGLIGGAYYIIYCDGSNFYYSTNGSSWSTVTTDATYMVIWDDKLWGIDDTGQLWYSLAPTTGSSGAFNNAKLVLGRAAEVQGLFVGRDGKGEEIIYAVTSQGLYAHDFDNGEFIKTGMAVPNKTTSTYTATAKATRWRDKIYFSSESTLFQYDPVAGVIASVGPDRDGGLPANYGIIISQLQPSLNELIAALDTTGSSTVALVVAWDGQGWQVLNQGAALARTTAMLVSGAYGDYRLWFAADAPIAVYYIKRPSDLINPLRNTATTYIASGTHDWPWFTAGQSEVTKVAVRVKVETLNPTTSETVILSYATDWVESFTAFATITTAGVTTFPFPNSTTPTGTAFKAIRFRAALARGGTTTNTPQVISVTLEYYKKLDPKYQFIVALDLTQEYKGKTPFALRTALLTAQETAPLVEFTYHDVGTDADATFYVQVRPQQSNEETGLSEKGTSQLLLVEV